MKAVENVFIDVTGNQTLLRSLAAQHQKHFPGSVIARWEINGATYVKVPYMGAESRPVGLTRLQFEALLPVETMAGKA